MNYGELKQAILDDTHRPALSTHVARFVRQCEGMIRRDLRGYIMRYNIVEADRETNGVYNLPDGVLEIRRIIPSSRQGDALDRVGPGQIRRLSTTADVVQYAQNGDGTIEFRGVPAEFDIFQMIYYGMPAALVDDTDENDLLTDHETLYMSGSKFFLYLHTQDGELASYELDIFTSIMKTLNDSKARELGGATIAPAYNFSGGSAY